EDGARDDVFGRDVPRLQVDHEDRRRHDQEDGEPQPFLVRDQRDGRRDRDGEHEGEQDDLADQPSRAASRQARGPGRRYRCHGLAPPPSPRPVAVSADPVGLGGTAEPPRPLDGYCLAIPSRIALAAPWSAVAGSVPPTIDASAMPNGVQTWP